MTERRLPDIAAPEEIFESPLESIKELEKKVKELDEKYKLEPEQVQKAIYYSQWEKARKALEAREKELDEGHSKTPGKKAAARKVRAKAGKRGSHPDKPKGHPRTLGDKETKKTPESQPERLSTRKLLEQALTEVEKLKPIYKDDEIVLGRIDHTLNAARSALGKVEKGGKYKGMSAVEIPGGDGQEGRVQQEGVPVDQVIALLRRGAGEVKAPKNYELLKLAGKIDKASVYYFDMHFPRSDGKLMKDRPALTEEQSERQHLRTRLEAYYIWSDPQYRAFLIQQYPKYAENTADNNYQLAMEVMRRRKELAIFDEAPKPIVPATPKPARVTQVSEAVPAQKKTELVSSPEKEPPKSVSGLNETVLKGIFDRAHAAKQVYFGKNFDLSQEEVAEVNKLLASSKEYLESLKQQLGKQWGQFMDIIERQRAQGIMTWGTNYVVADPQATECKAEMNEGKLTVTVPPGVKAVHGYQRTHDSARETTQLIGKPDPDHQGKNFLYGRNAKQYTQEIKLLYKFCQTRSESEKKVSSPSQPETGGIKGVEGLQKEYDRQGLSLDAVKKNIERVAA